MFSRIVRSLIVLGVLVGAYRAYVLLAVPLMEPPLAVRQSRPATPGERYGAAQSLTTYQLLLSNYFPRDHWSQTRPPKVLASSNEQAMLVVDDWKRQSAEIDGKSVVAVSIERFALLVFRTPPRLGITPPRDAIILEAPRGAELQFDDFRPEVARIGQIVGGQFPGRITIRSDMHEAGPEDDLLVETSDLKINTKLLYTTSPVRFRLGANVGGGRELEIRFLADEHVRPRDSGLKIAGIDGLEIRHDVRMRLQLETSSLLPGGDDPGSHAPRGNPIPGRSGGEAATSTQSVGEVRSHAERGNERLRPPVEVKCSGPFNFDFVRYVASLDRDVELRQLNPNGPSDQLSCTQLDIHFAPKPDSSGVSQPVVVDAGKRQQRDLGRLEPASIVAEGHPVVVASPARSAQARGDRIQIVLRDQRVRISGGRDAMLVYGPNVLRAPAIDYQHPPGDAATSIGQFRASGPGTLHYLPDPAKPQQVFQAAWQTSVDLSRENGQPVLTLDGRPQLAFAAAGALRADQMKIYLRELERKPAGVGLSIAGMADGGGELRVAPDRLAATGQVEIHSAQLTGRTGELLAKFRTQPDTPADRSATAAQGGPTGRFTTPASGGKPQQAFHVDSDKIRMDVNMQGESMAPATLACEGNVVIRETPLENSPEQPLEIRGAQLTVDRLDTPVPYITLRGEAAGAAAGRRRAQLAGRGVTVLADVVEIDGRDNRMWSNGPGQATLLVTRDLDGGTSATPFPLEIHWQGGLSFDGIRTIVVERNVLVAGADDKLRCDRLAARLTAPIQFGQGAPQQAIDLAEIECQGHVTLDHLSRDAVGVTSHERMQLAKLTINQTTGAVSGVGPGIVRSTRFGDGMAALTARPDAAPPRSVAPPPGAGASKLHFLRVDFRSGLAGNIYTRELEFMDSVRAVYGPVDSWEQELDQSRPETLPPEAMTLTCDKVRINEDSVAARATATASVAGADNRPIGPVQLRAQGNVRIEGQSPSQGAFSAHAERASYERSKDTFVLEGDGRTPARLWRAGQQGEPPAVRRIRYVPSTGELEVNGVQYLEITPGDIENARRPAAPVR